MIHRLMVLNMTKKGRKLTPQELHDKKFGIDRQLVNLLGRTSNKKCKCKTN
jgi:hypothetical protein